MKQTLLGLGSVIFPLIALLAMATLLIVAPRLDPDAQIPPQLLPFVIAGMGVLMVSVAGVLGLMIYYILHAARSQTFSDGAKAAWICSLWMLNIFVIPIYWLKYIRVRQNAS